jgi:hypothetical protein
VISQYPNLDMLKGRYNDYFERLLELSRKEKHVRPLFEYNKTDHGE